MSSYPGPASRLATAGFAMMLIAVCAGVVSGEYGLLLGLTGVLVGANLVALGVGAMADELTTAPLAPAALTGVVDALVWILYRNLNVEGLATMVTSSVVTAAAVAREASSVLCLSVFALFLLGLCLVAVGVLGD